MAKKKKQDANKKAVLQAQKEAKQAKKAQKRISKQQQKSTSSSGDGAADNDTQQSTNNNDLLLDQIIETYRKHDKKIAGIEKPMIVDLETSAAATTATTTFPLPRANATLEYAKGGSSSTVNSDHLYLFGGEYFNGAENIVVDELLRYDVLKQEWKQIMTVEPRPAPRCAHVCIAYKSSLYIFGGELATSDQYHHYRDLWKFHIPTLTWIEIKAKHPPSARSGMGCLVWKHYMIVFGGFFEAARETKWYNDVHIFDLQSEVWLGGGTTTTQVSRLAVKPEPRSACNIASYGADKLIIHGGFSKLKIASGTIETKTHTDAWILHLLPILQQKPPTWERWISSSSTKRNSTTRNTKTPNGRAGMSSLSYKNKLLVFGGVIDHEEQNHKVDSIFYNDLMSMDIDRRKWFPVHVKNKTSGNKQTNSTTKSEKRRRRRKQDDDGDNDGNDYKQEEKGEKIKITEEDDDDDSISSNTSSVGIDEDIIDDDDDDVNNPNSNGWDINMLRSNMFAFVDGNGNIVYEKIEADDDDNHEEKKVEEEDDDDDAEETKEDEETKDDEEEEEETKEEEKEDEPRIDAEQQYKKSGAIIGQQHFTKKVASSSVMVMNETNQEPEAVQRDEPLPRINASTLIHGNTMYVMGGILEVGDREITLDDMWSLDLRKRDAWECLWHGTMYKQVWRGAVHDDDDSYISTGLEDNDDDGGSRMDLDDIDDDESDFDDENNGKEDRRKAKELKRKSLRQEISELNETYELDDTNRTPQNNESVADFYSRTIDYWISQATEQLVSDDCEPLTHKELKRQGFILAKEQYENLTPVLERLAELGIGSNDGTKDSNRSSKECSGSNKKEKKGKKEKKKKKDKK